MDFLEGWWHGAIMSTSHGPWNHRQSKEWTGNAGKIANVVDVTSIMRPDTLYIGTLYLHFKYISRLCIYKF